MKGASYRERAMAMLKVLRSKGAIDLYDVMLQFDVSHVTARYIFKLTKKLCESSNECVEHEGKLVYIGDQKEVEELLNGDPV